jgi:hypothetical protein
VHHLGKVWTRVCMRTTLAWLQCLSFLAKWFLNEKFKESFFVTVGKFHKIKS